MGNQTKNAKEEEEEQEEQEEEQEESEEGVRSHFGSSHFGTRAKPSTFENSKSAQVF